MNIFAFDCWVDGTDWHKTVNAQNRSKAKYRYWCDVTDAWPDIPISKMRVRKLGAPVTSSEFLRNAKYRGIPHARCGDRVSFAGGTGFVVGHNDSANLDILVETGPGAGRVANIHPFYVKIEEKP